MTEQNPITPPPELVQQWCLVHLPITDMEDYKQLCVELVRIADALDSGTELASNQGQAMDGYSALAAFRDVAYRARAALAESEPEEPTDEEIMALMPQQMHEDLAFAARAMAEHAGTDSTRVKGLMRIALNRHVVDHARTVLARWGRSVIEPAQESEGQPLARVEFAKQDFNGPSDVVLAKYCDDWFYGDPERTEVDPVDLCRGAIRLFAQPLAPVPVSERLPGSEDCDAKGCCWVHDSHGQWFLIHHRAVKLSSWGFSHWLPHWALPKPQKGGDND